MISTAKNTLVTTFFLSFVFSCSGCVFPEKINEVQVTSVPANIHAVAQVEKAILIAGKSLDWAMQLTDENEITATFATRKIRIVVVIPFSKHGYSIKFKESTNLDYNAEKNTISPSYNSIITELDNAIQANLYAR